MREEFGQRLRDLRARLGLAQAELARHLGVDRTQVCNWEKGRHLPAMELLPPLCRALRTTTDYLLGVTDSAVAAEPVAPPQDPVRAYISDSIQALQRVLSMLEPPDGASVQELEKTLGRRLPILSTLPTGALEEAEAHAGAWTVVPSDWLRPRDEAFIWRVGDSTAPILEPGDLVVVKRQNGAHAGNLVLAVVHGKVLVTRVARTGRGALTLKPDDPSHDSVPVGEGATIHGKIVGLLRRFKRSPA